MLLRATPEQANERDRLSYVAWGSGLSPANYQARERMLRAGPWSRRTLETWLLVEAGEVLASCETYRVACSADTRMGSAWLIASVFTEPQLRGRGHASRMLSLLADQFACAPDALALVLFSDVGVALYERIGFVALPAADRVWPASSLDPDDGPWTRISEFELASAWSQVVPCGGRVRLWPTAEQLEWQIDRSRILAEHNGTTRPARCGAILGNGAIVWTDHEDELIVLAWVGDPRLLEAAARSAAASGRSLVRAWDTPGVWPMGQRVPRTTAIPMMRPLSSSATPEQLTFLPRALWV